MHKVCVSTPPQQVNCCQTCNSNGPQPSLRMALPVDLLLDAVAYSLIWQRVDVALASHLQDNSTNRALLSLAKAAVRKNQSTVDCFESQTLEIPTLLRIGGVCVYCCEAWRSCSVPCSQRLSSSRVKPMGLVQKKAHTCQRTGTAVVNSSYSYQLTDRRVACCS